MTSLNGKTELVTGASSGIGKSTVELLLSAGVTVYAAARRIEKIKDLKSLGDIPIKMDITKEGDVFVVVEKIKQGHGGVDVLINNDGKIRIQRITNSNKRSVLCQKH